MKLTIFIIILIVLYGYGETEGAEDAGNMTETTVAQHEEANSTATGESSANETTDVINLTTAKKISSLNTSSPKANKNKKLASTKSVTTELFNTSTVSTNETVEGVNSTTISIKETTKAVNSTTVSFNGTTEADLSTTASSVNEISETVNSTTVSVNETTEAVNSTTAFVNETMETVPSTTASSINSTTVEITETVMPTVPVNATTASSVNDTTETVNSTTVSVNATTASSVNETSEAVNSTTVSVNATTASSINETSEGVNSTTVSVNAATVSVNATTASSANATSEAVDSTTVSDNATTASSANATSEAVDSTTVSDNATTASSVNETSEAVNSTSANVTMDEFNASTVLANKNTKVLKKLTTATKKRADLETSTTKVPMKTNATWPKSVTVGEQKLTFASVPPYIEMIKEAITSLNSKKGSSKGAILSYIMDNFNVGNNAALVFDKMNSVLLQAANVGELVKVYGLGSSVYFKLGDVTVPMPKTLETDVDGLNSVTMEVVL